MTLVTGTVQDLGYDGMEGTLWARPARFRSDGQVVYAPERKPYKVVDGVVSADLAPGPAVLELQVGSHARGTFEVVIPEEDTTLADLLDTVFAWEPAQVSLFVAEREAAELAKVEAEAAAGQAVTAAQQTGQDRSHVDQVRTELDEAFDESTAGNVLPPRLTETALNATYAQVGDIPEGVVKSINGQTPDEDGVIELDLGNPDAITGTGIKKMTATADPDYLPADGEYVIYYETPSLSTDFSEHPTGPGIPDGWTERWVPGASWSIEADASALGGKVLRVGRVTPDRQAISFDAVGTVTDVEILYKWRALAGSSYAGSIVRGSGGPAAETGYWARRTSTSVLTGRYVDGVSSNMGGHTSATTPEGVWHLTRMRANGNTIMGRTWPATSQEPTSWQNSSPDDNIPGPGWVGLLVFSTSETEFDWVSIAADGHVAPMLGGA